MSDDIRLDYREPVEEGSNDVGEANACPHCGERHCDNLTWLEDETVQCSTCGHDYRPGMPTNSTGTTPDGSGT